MASAQETLDDDQATTAVRAWQIEDAGLVTGIIVGDALALTPIRRLRLEQLPDRGDIGGAASVAEEAVMPDAVLAFGPNMDQEAADERAAMCAPCPL